METPYSMATAWAERTIGPEATWTSHTYRLVQRKAVCYARAFYYWTGDPIYRWALSYQFRPLPQPIVAPSFDTRDADRARILNEKAA